MSKFISDIDKELLEELRKGTVIPAQPLAIDENRQFLPKYQRALCRYYIDAGVGGIAVGVHSTQFEIRDKEINLFERVLSETSQFIDEWAKKKNRKVLKVAGVCGQTQQAIYEAKFAESCNYDAVLLSLGAFAENSVEEMLEHCKKIAKIMPVIGFYLQKSVGGRSLPYEFWKEFAKIDNVLAIKMAPFNRYQTFDVVRAVAESKRDITLYTGNDDNIIVDLLTPYEIVVDGEVKHMRIKGGLLGHWCCWTQKAVELLKEIHYLIDNNLPVPMEMLAKNIKVTDSNAAFFDPKHDFAGCIPGIHEVLYRQGLMLGTWCLNPKEVLSEGQSEEIDRVYASYLELNDDNFVKENLEEWLAN